MAHICATHNKLFILGLDHGATVDEYFGMLCQLEQGAPEDKLEQFLAEYAARNDTDKALKQAIRLWTRYAQEGRRKLTMITPLKHPYIPLTDPPAQLDAVFHFCTAWGGPIILDYNSQKMVLMSLRVLPGPSCATPEEAEEIQKQMAEYKAKHEDMEEA